MIQEEEGPAAPPCIAPAPGQMFAHGRVSAASLGCSCGRAPRTWPPAAFVPAGGFGNPEYRRSAESTESADWPSEP